VRHGVGIRVDSIKIWCFVLGALLGGLMGILDGYHLGSLDPATDGLTFTFYGVTSAVIGAPRSPGDAAPWSVPASERACWV
jgi:simple sugar transport system permease protein